MLTALRVRSTTLLVLACFSVLTAPADAQSRWSGAHVAPATLAPEPDTPRTHNVALLMEVTRVDEGIAYGMLNALGPDNDTYGLFDPQDPFEVTRSDPYPNPAFAGTILSDGRFYYVLQSDDAAHDSLGRYDFDTQEIETFGAVTFLDDDDNIVPADQLPQWVDAGVNTETGEMILLGRSGACTEKAGGELWRLDLITLRGKQTVQFTDSDNCPLSMAYDNENGVVIGMVPNEGIEAFYQTDLETGETIATIPLPDDLFLDTVTPFAQSGATNYGLNGDASDNEHYFFLFEGVNPDLVSTSRLINFDGDGIIESSTNFGEIGDDLAWQEVLAVGFLNANPTDYPVSEDSAQAQVLEFVGVYPNPLRTAATIPLRLTAPTARLRAVVHDVLGREVLVLHNGPLGAGDHTLRFASRGLPAGTYLVSIQSGAVRHTRTVAVVN